MSILVKSLTLAFAFILCSTITQAAMFSWDNSSSEIVSVRLNFDDNSTLTKIFYSNSTDAIDIGTKVVVSVTINGQTVGCGQTNTPVYLPSTSTIYITIDGVSDGQIIGARNIVLIE